MLLEIRPGEGGDDAVNFAEELRSALSSYARAKGCSVTPDNGPNSRTMVMLVQGPAKCLQFATGVHRIQRQPKNDRKGRRHTSTATVALLDEGQTMEIAIRKEDCLEECYRGSGPGGQHRNKTDTAVRIHHAPSGITVSAEDSKSQWQNRQNAYAKLRRILEDQDRTEALDGQQQDRTAQISSGERPVKEFTWNTQRGEVLDHSNGTKWSIRDAFKGKF